MSIHDDDRDDAADDTTDAATASDTTPTTDTTDTTPAKVDHAAAFQAAWNAAVDIADDTTGDVPTAALDAVKAAYRRIPAASRGAIVAASAAGTGAIATADPASPIVPLLLASAKLSAAVNEAAEQGATRERVVRDPLDIAAERVALLTVARDAVLAALDDDDARTDALKRSGAIVSADATDALTAKLARIVKALGSSGSRGGGGTRGASGSIPAAILAAFHAVDDDGNFQLPTGEPIGYGRIAAVAGRSAGAVQNALPGGSSDPGWVGMTTTERTASDAVRLVVVADRDALALADDAADDDDDDA